MMHRRLSARLLVVALLASALALVATSAPAASQTPSGTGDEVVAFDQAAAVAPGALTPIERDKLAHATRARFVEIGARDVSAFGSAPVSLELFPGLVVALDGDGPAVPGQNGSTTWSGLAENGDYATLTFIGGRTIGTVVFDGAVYDISPVSGTTHLIVEEGRQFPDEVEPLPGDSTGGDASTATPAPPAEPGSAPAEAGPVVDVLTWYDTAARTYFGDDAAAQAELAATVNETNAAYVRSGVNQSVRSVGIEFVAYSGSGTAGTELSRLQSTTDGVLDSVHTRRNALGADLVSLISPLSDACGIGYLGGPASGVNGFTVVEPSCARGNLSYAHELGHNMGAGHGDPDGSGLFSYSNGYRDIVNGFRTIMAYNSSSCPGGSCQRVAYFSSPTVLFNGRPTGSATQDNARTISERAAITAGYRNGTGPSGPANDNFAAAQALNGVSGSVAGTNVGATKETGEPNHRSTNAGGRSVWYRWTAPNGGQATFETCGSGFDTVLAAYTGAAVNALTRIAENDDACGNATDRITFTATSGTTYRIAVDGYNAASGTVALRWNLTIPRPANDSFASARVLSGRTTSATSTNVGATRQTGEPRHANKPGDTSVWFRWTAPRTERVEINTANSSFDTLLGVYRGSTVAALTTVASNDDISGSLQSRVRFNATAGRVYRIAVAGYQNAAGGVRLQIKPA